MGFGQSQSEAAKEKAVKALSDFLRPEFIGRVDEVVFFRPLSVEDFRSIAGLMLEELKEALTQRGIALTWSEAALTALATAAHGGKRGARDLRNVIRRQVEDVLATEIVARYEIPPTAVSIDANGEGGVTLNYT